LKKEFLIIFCVSICLTLTGNTFYISPNGKDSNIGTITQPFFTLNKAWTVASAGDILYMRGGTYNYSGTCNITGKSGTSGNLIKVWNYPGESPVISGVSNGNQSIMTISNADYVHFKGIRFTNLAQQHNPRNGYYGVLLWKSVNHCTFELIETDHIGGWGITIGDNCSDLLFLNCDSHHNEDPYSNEAPGTGDPYGGSDGFESGSHGSGTSTNITFRGCRSWANSDDGWDLRQADGVYTLDNCWSFWNGYQPSTVGSSWTSGGNGVGLKLGGKTSPGTNSILRTIKNSLSFGNRMAGITPEPDASDGSNNLGVLIYNCVAYQNGDYGIGNGNHSNYALVRNCIAYNNNEDARIQTGMVHDHNSFDISGTVSDADFMSVNSSGVDGPRQADGSLPNISFLHLSTRSHLIDAGVDVGIPYSGNSPDLGAFEYQDPSSTPVPKFISAVVQDATPSLLEITYDLSLNSLIVPAISSFNVVENSVSRTVNAADISGTKVKLTLVSPVVYDDTIIVSYTKPSQNPLQTSSGGQADSFTAKTVTNNCSKPSNPGDPPVLVINYPKTVYEGFVSEIDATSTYDPNNDSLKFEWEVPKGVPVSTVKSLKTQFLAPYVDKSKTVEFQLKVSNSLTNLSNDIPITVLPYKPELISARIMNITASDFQTPDYPYNILDGNISTKWSSNGDNKWLIMKLAQPFEISHLKIGFLPEQKYVSYFDIYASLDNLFWEPVLIRATSCGFSGEIQIFEFPPSISTKEFSYIKFLGHGNSLNSWNNISEFKIFGSPQNNPDSTKDIKSKILIYPNPVRDFINISVEEPALEFDSVRIIDFSGMIVYEKVLNQIVKSVQLSLNLKSGVYLLYVSLHNSALHTQKLIVYN
jgi:hypothetical protein